MRDTKERLGIKAVGRQVVGDNDPNEPHSRLGIAGKFEVEGDQITLKTDRGFSSRGKIQGKTLIDKDGDRWTKQ